MSWTQVGSHRWLPVLMLGLFLSGFAMEASAAEETRIVVEGFEARRNRTNMSLQLHATGLHLSEDYIDPNGSSDVGGLALSWHWDLARWVGLEIYLGSMGRASENGRIEENQAILSFNSLWYFARDHDHRLYGIVGLGVMGTMLKIDESQYQYNEEVFTLGLGSEWLIGRNWLLSVDGRLYGFNRDSEGIIDAVDDNGNVLREDGKSRGNRVPASWLNPPTERSGVAFNVGFGYRW